MTRTRRTTEYWHFDLAGEPRVEESALLAEERGTGDLPLGLATDAIESVSRVDAPLSEYPAAD